MCCGQKRFALRSVPFSGTFPVPARPPINWMTGRSSTGPGGPDVRPRSEARPEANTAGLALVQPVERVPVNLRYVRTAPVRIAGEVSGKQYEFSGSRPTQPVDPRDLFQLLSTGYFSRA